MYSWCAIMKDGTRIYQNATSPEKHISEIDTENMERLELIPITADMPPVILKWKSGRKLVYKKQVVGVVAAVQNSTILLGQLVGQSPEIEFFTVGWSEIVENDEELQYLMHIYPNGSIELSSGEPSFITEFARLYFSKDN